MSESVLRHLTREGDRWDLIAWRYYGNPLEISRLIAANPHLPLAEQFGAGVRAGDSGQTPNPSRHAAVAARR
mgnify:CR=1 FL=1